MDTNKRLRLRLRRFRVQLGQCSPCCQASRYGLVRFLMDIKIINLTAVIGSVSKNYRTGAKIGQTAVVRHNKVSYRINRLVHLGD